MVSCSVEDIGLLAVLSESVRLPLSSTRHGVKPSAFVTASIILIATVLDRDVTGRLYRKAPADVSLFGWQSEMHVDSVRELGRVSRKELEKDTVSGGSVCSVATVRISVNVLGLDLIPTGKTKDAHRVESGNVYPCLPSGEERTPLQCRQRR